ncbi:MAG TPA: TAT-variant-translocated molybdopterin oxidoreductase [Terriglobales bacterium]|nr:TAT-variant-translocated molybdopterin oxidoreductase [Terriglobales bacterium]
MELRDKKAQAPRDETDKGRASAEAVCPSKKELLYQIEPDRAQKQLTSYDFESARQLLAGKDGPEYWRSLEELVGTKEFQEQLHREFPKGASEWLDPVSRRGFLKLMGASVALAGLSGCIKQPLEPIVPYVRQPEQVTLGKPAYYATAMTLNGYGIPLLAKSSEGRPSKIEGNPQHPASMGGTDVFSQASVLDLYDPDRAETVLFNGEIKTWPGFLGGVRAALVSQRANQGATLRILTQTVNSPTLAAQIRKMLQAFPAAKWYQWDPINRDNVRAGAQMAFGQYVESQYRMTEADVVVSLDANFLSSEFPGFTKYSREFASRRRPEKNPAQRPFTTVDYTPLPDKPINRFYAIESTPTNTGAKADHRISVKFGDVEKYARILAGAVGINAGGGNANSDHDGKVLAAIAKDLQAHRGTSLIIAGDEQPPVVHAMAHAMNEALGNVGKTVVYTDPVEANPTDQLGGIKELTADMWAGKVEMLIISGGNPVYDTPIDLNFVGALQKIPLSVYHGLYDNETAAMCNWLLQGAHYLEQWSDARAIDGSVMIVQPLIAPLYGGKSAHELFNAFSEQPEASGYDTVRGFWQAQHAGPDFEAWWQKSVHDGFMAGTAYVPKAVQVRTTNFPPPAQNAGANAGGSVEMIFRPDPSIYDGRFANNAWLQELAKPMTKVVWDNPVLISPRTAARLDVHQGDVVEIQNAGQKVEVALWIQPGHPDDSITVFLGYGRQRAGRVGTGMGFNSYLVRASNAMNVVQGVSLRKTGGTYQLITTQGFQSMEARHVVREAKLDEYRRDPEFAHRVEAEPEPGETLYPNYEYSGYAWGMAIDQNACVGCNSCIIACQAENNIAVVGKTEVSRGRHMHWLRVDTYYAHSLENPKIYFQPVPCMHCENAPCELVCPVGATVHDTEGINDMIYNRCVGTRYCSNNCPYKVRRFNFLLYQDWVQPQFKMMRNPDVSVRSRGVMEKCSYCIQRITHARIDAEEHDRLIADGSLQTACQQVCPADAIVFGNLNDKNSRVVKLKENPRNYGLLADLNTRPRTTYLAAVTNPNPEIPEAAEKS